MKVDPAFQELVEGEDLEDMDSAEHTIYAVWADLTLAFINEAWFEFARQNDAPDEFFEQYGIGSSIDLDTDGSVQGRFKECAERSMQTETIISFEFECPSPRIYRRKQVTFLPLGHKACIISVAGLVTTTHEAQGRTPRFGLPSEFRNEVGLITMCSCCRLIRVPGEAEAWEFVPKFIERSVEGVSHGLCPSCKAFMLTPTAEPKNLEISDLTGSAELP